MFNTEFDNFVRKFFQLRQAGLTAHLDVDTQAGQVRVALSVELGAGHAPGQQPPRRSRSPSYYRRQVRRKADREAAGRTSNTDESVPKAPAGEAEARGEDVPGSSAGEAAAQTEDVPEETPAAEVEVRDEETQTIMANSRIFEADSEFSEKEYGELYASIGWKESYRVGNFEGIIIEAIASVEEIDDSEGSDFYHRNLKCKHCRTWWQEQYFYEHQCYDRKSWFCDEMRARIRAGAADTAAICSL